MTHEILPGVCSDTALDDLRDRYRRCDIAAVDLDECMMPGFAQVVVARRILWRVGLRPRRMSDVLRVPSLVRGGLAVTAKKAVELLGFEFDRPKMMFTFERTMRGVSREYFGDAVRGIASFCRAGVGGALRALAERMPVGIVSFCLEMIVREFVLRFNSEKPGTVSFEESNRLEFVTVNGREVLKGYDRSRFMTSKEDKRASLEERMREYTASRPVIIGHSHEDVGMAGLARERDGLAVGFNPLDSCAREFGVVVRGRDWSPIEGLFRLLGQG